MRATTAIFLTALVAAGADFVADFAALRRHAEGAGRAELAEGTLLLDLRAAAVGKHAWAEAPVVLKLPATVEWEQRTEADSPHFYRAGLFLRDAFGRLARIGFSGQPQGHLVAMDARLVPDARHRPGTWYRFRLEVGADHHARLAVRPRDAEDPVWTAEGRFGTAGPLCTLGFYHNQEPHLPPDEYAQDRGASRFANLRATAAALHRGTMESYRDAQVRGYSAREPMAFNRAMRWIRTEGAVLAYDAAPAIRLTGAEPAADWAANRGCRFEATDAESSAFVRPNDLDGPDRAALRCLQWCLRQHPFLEYEMEPDGGACALEVVLPCPYLDRGLPLLRIGPTAEATAGRIDLRPLFRDWGLEEHQYGEIGLHLSQERGGAEGESRCRVRLALTGDGALVTSVPLVRSPEQAGKGIRIAAIRARGDGTLDRGAAVAARWPGGSAALSCGADGVYTATLPPLPLGRHWLELADGSGAGARLLVVVTDPAFARRQPGRPGYVLPDGSALPPLLGDLLAWVPMLDPALPSRQVVASATVCETLAPDAQARIRLLKLRTLGRAHLAAMLDEHARNGFGIVRLTPNVTPHESFLDAGGHVAPYSLETLCWVLDECRQRDIRALVNLFHYPYWSGGTGRYPPWRQYLDAGYRDDRSFLDPALAPMLHGYLAELLVHLRDDPAVLGYSLTGENDQTYGPEWINALHAVVLAHDPNHLVSLEQGGGMQQCAGGHPAGYDAFVPATSAGVGYRTYYTAGLPSDAYMMLCGRFYSARPPAFMAEVASGPGWHGGFRQNWTHPDFLTKVRDATWMAVLRQQTLCITWSAPWTQEERLVPRRCMEAMDWNRFARRRPPAAVRLGGAIGPLLPRLGEIEAALAAAGIDYDFVWDDEAAGGYSWVIDPALPLPEIPAAVLADRPLAVSPGYSANLLRGDGPFQMLAFVKNTAEYRLGPGYGHGVRENHRQRTALRPLVLAFADIPPGTRLVVHDVDERREVRAVTVDPGSRIDLGATGHDFALVLRADR